MVKRIKKPPVLMEQRHDWLRRNEDFGETPPKIAKKDGYDVRTVRTQLERARQERDQKQARISFVKDNMEKHHQDMCLCAENMLSQLTAERALDLDFSEDLYLEAMRQHMTRSPLWKNIKIWNTNLVNLEQLKVNVKNHLERSLKKTELNCLSSNVAGSVLNAAVVALTHQFVQWSRGSIGLDMKIDWIVEDRKDSKISVRYGFSHFDWIEEDDLDTIKGVVGRYEKRIKKWRDYKEMEKQFGHLRELGKFIRNELRGVIIRRILPGSCIYCPI